MHIHIYIRFIPKASNGVKHAMGMKLKQQLNGDKALLLLPGLKRVSSEGSLEGGGKTEPLLDFSRPSCHLPSLCQSRNADIGWGLEAHILYQAESGRMNPFWSQLDPLSSSNISLGHHAWPFAHCFGSLCGASLDPFKAKSCQIGIQKQSKKQLK